MIIKTYSAKKLQEDFLSISRPFALISINSPGLPKISLPTSQMMISALYLTFFDVDDLSLDRYDLFSIRHAEEIVGLVDTNKDKVDEIIVQCELGESRSTAIAMVLELYLNHSKKASNRYPKYYSPNKRVYKILKDYIYSE